MIKLPIIPKGVSALAANAETPAGLACICRDSDGMSHGRLSSRIVADVTATDVDLRRIEAGWHAAAGRARSAVSDLAANPPTAAGRRATARLQNRAATVA